MANQKLILEVSTKIDREQTLKSAKEMSKIISEGVLSADQKKSAEKYFRIVEESLRRIQFLEGKKDLNKNELNNLKIYISNLEDGIKKLDTFMEKTTASPNEKLKDFQKRLADIAKTAEEARRAAERNFKSKTNVSFGDAPQEVSNLEKSIKDQESKIQDIYDRTFLAEKDKLEKSRALDQEAINAAKLKEERILADYNNANNLKLKNYQDYLDHLKRLDQEAERISNERRRKAIAKSSVTSMAGTDQARVQKILDYKFNEARKTTELKKLGIAGVDSIDSAKGFVEDPESNKAYATFMLQKAKEIESSLAEQVKLIREKLTASEKITKELEEEQRIQSQTVINDAEIERLAKEAAKTATGKDSKNLGKDKDNLDKLKTEFTDTATALDNLNTKTAEETKKLQELALAEEKILSHNLDEDRAKVAQTVNQTNASLSTYKNGLTQLDVQIAKTEAKQEAFGKVFSGIAGKIAQVTSVIFLLRKAMQQLKKGYQVVSEIDKGLTEIGIVTKQTVDELWKSFDRYNQAAAELNTTTRKYLEGAKIFYQQGMNTAEVMYMVEATTRAAALSSVSFESASETLTAAIRGYNMEASQASAVTDKFAAVGAASAADFRELSVAMEKVASSAYASGMEFDSLLGILAKGIETTREAPAAIGTALKTIIARFQEMKENPMADLEDGINANRVEKALKTVGVALRDASGEFRDLDDVFNDLGDAWQDLSRNQKAYIATMAAGSRQQSRFMAIMNNYDRTLQLTRISTNSAGEAMKQFEIYADSMEASQNKLTNATEAFYVSLMKPELIKGLLDLGTQGLNLMADLNPLILLVTASMGLLIAKIYIYNTALKVKLIAEGAQKAVLPKLANLLLKKATADGVVAKATSRAAAAQMAYNIYLTAAIAVVAGLVIAIIAYTKWIKEQEKAVHKLAATEQANANKQAEKAKTLDALVDRYQELDRKMNKSNEEQSEYLELIKQIAEISPDLVDSIDAEGNALLKRNDELERGVAAQKAEALLQQKRAYSKRIDSLKSAKWDADVEMGGLEKSAEIAGEIKGILEQMKTESNKIKENVEELMLDPQFMAADGGNLAKAVGLSSLFEQWFGSDSVFDKDTFDAAEKLAEDYLNGSFKGSIEELYNQMLATLEPGSEEYEKFKEQVDILFEKVKDYQKVKTSEVKMLMRSGLYTEGQYDLDILESDGKNVTEAMRTVASQIANESVRIASSLDETTIGVEDAALSEGEKVIKFAQHVQDQMLAVNKQLVDQKGFSIDLESLFKFTSGDLSPVESLEEFGSFRDKYISTITDPNLKQAAIEYFDTISKTIFNEEDFNKRLDNMAHIYEISVQKVSKTLGEDTVDWKIINLDQMKEDFKLLPKSVSNFLLNAVDNIDDDQAKAQYIATISTVFDDSDAGKERAKELQSLIANTDLSDPTQVQNFKNKFKDFLTEATSLTEDEKNTIVGQFLDVEVILTDFLKKAKSSYEEFKALQDDVIKSASGLDLGQSLDMVTKYGAGAVNAIGEVFYLTGSAIQKEYSRIQEQVVKDLESSKTLLDQEIESRNSEIRSGTADAKRLKILNEQLETLKEQKVQMDKIAEAATKLSGADLARMANQNLLTGINAVSATAGSLKEIASLYERINDGSMTQLDIFNAIANNPDYLQFLTIQNGKLAFSAQLIEKETEARIAGMKTAIQERKVKVKAMIASLETYVNQQGVMSEADSAKAENAVKALEAETQAEQLSQGTIQEELANTGNVVGQLDNLQQQAHDQEMKRIQAEIDAYKARTRAMAGDLTATAGSAYQGGQITKIDVPTGPELVKEGSWVDKLAGSLGASGTTPIDKAKNSLTLLKTELEKLNALEKEIDTWKPKDFLAMAGSSKKSGSSGGGSGSSTKEFEKYFGEFDRYFNYLQKLEKLSSDISKIDAQIDLSSTGGAEDIRLIQEKSKKIKEQTSVLEQLLAVRKQNLTVDRIEMKAKYGKYVSFEGDQIKVRWDLINAMQITSEKQEKEYEAMLEAIDAYTESSAAIDENTQSLLENAKALEEQAEELEDQTTDLRQRLYDALVEADQREIDATKEKYDKMKEAESDYLSAVKDAIDKERQMRDDSNKEEDLAQKKRKLAVLERDTSGLYTQEAERLRGEINKDEQTLRDQSVDRQYEALQKQYELQQEQRDLEVKSLEEQMATRQENGYYWSMVDQAIRSGPEAMMSILESTDAYQKMDPFAKGKEGETIKNDVSAIAEIFKIGKEKAGPDASVEDIINAGIEGVTNPATTTPAVEPPATTTPPTTSGATPYPGKTVRYGAKGELVKIVQKSLNDAISAGLKVDGSFGPATLAAVKSFQRKKGLSVDGIVGPKTWPKLVTKYKEGGLADFTGPAWVDGTPNKPEAFLDADQTKMFAHLRDLLEKREISNIGGTQINNPISIGDIIVNLQNPTNANPTELSKLIRKEILNTYQNRLTTSIQKSR